jgi:hypothetical protein
MVKRVASAVLWLFAVVWGFNFVSAITGAPSIIGLALGVAVAVFVGMDPVHLFWPVRAAAVVAPTRAAAPATGAMQTQV